MFTQALSLFGVCHRVYNTAKRLTEDQIDMLSKYINSYNPNIRLLMAPSFTLSGSNIKKFMAYYRRSFPEATVTPKLHMLEEHVVPQLRQWKTGYGFLGEQGAESIHAAINRITPSYVNMPDKVERLRGVMREHHRQVCPDLVVCQPAIKRRKPDSDNES